MEDYTYVMCPACGGEAVPSDSLACGPVRCQGCGLRFSVRPTGPAEHLDYVPGETPSVRPTEVRSTTAALPT